MATDSFIKQLMEERDTKVSVIENLASVAADEGRDLHETDLATIQNYRSRISIIDNQIEKVAGDLELADTVKARVRNLDPSVIAKDWTYRTAGEYMHDALHRHEDSDANGRFTKFHARAAQHMGLDKANTVPTAGGFNGLVVAPNVGAVLDPTPTGRPLFNALGVRPITSANFMRPRIVDPYRWTGGVAPQGQEKAELVSKAWDIVSDPVQAQVVGGYINVSQLLIEMIASSLDMVVQQMNRRLEYACEYAAIGEMEQTTAVVTLATSDAAAVTAAIGEASALVFANTGALPTWIAMGPEAWGRLIGVSDLAGRPLLPAVGPVNAWGSQGGADQFITTFGGLRAIVSYAISDSEMFVGNSFGLEVYEKSLPVLSAVEPSVFGRQISVQTMLAFYRPVTTESPDGGTTPEKNDGIVKIDWT